MPSPGAVAWPGDPVQEEGPGRMSGTRPDQVAAGSGRRRWYEHLVAFVAGVLAVTLPEYADGLPSDLRGVVFTGLGGLAGGVLAVGVTRVLPWVLRPLSTVDQGQSAPAGRPGRAGRPPGHPLPAGPPPL